MIIRERDWKGTREVEGAGALMTSQFKQPVTLGEGGANPADFKKNDCFLKTEVYKNFLMVAFDSSTLFLY